MLHGLVPLLEEAMVRELVALSVEALAALLVTAMGV